MTPAAGRFGFIGTAPGVSTRHMWLLMYASFMTIGLATYDAFITPFVLSTNLGIPADEQGALTGRLIIYSEIVMLTVLVPAGILADRIGRRAIYAAGFCLLAAGYTLFPYATSELELAGARIIYSTGVAALTASIGTVMADYAVAESRGRLVGLVGILNGLGIVTSAAILGRLPRVFSDMGYDEFTTAQYTMAVVAGLCLVSAVVVGRGLKPGTGVAREARPPLSQLVRAGVRTARANPRVAVAYASAFVARGDMVVVGSFLVLWGKTAGVGAGLDAAEAIEAGRLPFIVSQGSALLFTLVALFVLDRVHRVTGLILAMATAATGYTLLILVDDPLSRSAIPFFVMLGIGQVSAFMGSQTLIGKEAPAAERGAVIGTFSACGALGILVSGGIGGALFDSIDPRAPFALMGFFNALVMLAAVWVRVYRPGPAHIPGAVQVPAG